MIGDLREDITGLVSPEILWVVFFVAVLIFIVVSIALMYHWRNYNTNSVVGKRVRRTYILISGVFLFAMLVAAISYST